MSKLVLSGGVGRIGGDMPAPNYRSLPIHWRWWRASDYWLAVSQRIALDDAANEKTNARARAKRAAA